MDVNVQFSEQNQTIDDEKNLLNEFVDSFDGNALNSLITECEDLCVSNILTKSNILLNENVIFENDMIMCSDDIIDLDHHMEEITTTNYLPEIDLVNVQIDDNWNQFDSIWSNEEIATTASKSSEDHVCELYEAIRKKFKLSNFDELHQYNFSTILCEDKTVCNENGNDNESAAMLFLLPHGSENVNDNSVESFYQKLQKNSQIINQLLNQNIYYAKNDESEIILPFKPFMSVEAEPLFEDKLKMIDSMEINVPMVTKRDERCRKKKYKPRKRSYLKWQQNGNCDQTTNDIDQCQPIRKSRRIQQKNSQQKDYMI